MNYEYLGLGFPGGSSDKEPTCNAGDLASIPGLGRSPGEGNSYSLQYSDILMCTRYSQTTVYMLLPNS